MTQLQRICKAGDPGLIPGSGRSPGEGNGNPIQYSYLENPMGRGAWRARVHRVVKSQTLLSTHRHTHTHENTKGNSSSVDRSSGEHRRNGTPSFPALNRFLILAECVYFMIVDGRNRGLLGVDTTWGPTPAQPFSHRVALGQ